MENVKGRNCTEDLGPDERIVLKCIYGTGFQGLNIRSREFID
jgi:hypothetical protein